MKKSFQDIQWNIYKNLKKKALDFEVQQSNELNTYRRNFNKFVKRDFTKTSTLELNKKIYQSEIIYIGDFHTFDQNIKNVTRIIDLLLKKEKTFCIGLEMVKTQHQKFIDAYLKNYITELEFLESINYRYSWRFPWVHYKRIFDLAKLNNISIHALNGVGTLKERDSLAAKRILKLKNNYEKIIVFYGEYHIVPNKLPKMLGSQAVEDIKQLIIYQNVDEVYWKLKKINTKNQIVKFNDYEYCITSSPPWLKYASLSYWFENINEDADFDIHDYILEKGRKIFNEDAKENFYDLSTRLNKLFKLNIDNKNLENFNLKDHSSLEFINDKIENIEFSYKKYLKTCLAKNLNFNICGSNIFYCGNYSMNNLAYLAGAHLYITQHRKWIKSYILEHNLKNNMNSFLAYILNLEIFSYFFSKTINPYRKCNMYRNFLEIKKKATVREKVIYEEICNTIKFEEFNCDSQMFINTNSIILFTQSLGHLLGEYLFTLVEQKNLNLDIKDIIHYPPSLDIIKTILRNEHIFSRKLNDKKRHF